MEFIIAYPKIKIKAVSTNLRYGLIANMMLLYEIKKAGIPSVDDHPKIYVTIINKIARTIT